MGRIRTCIADRFWSKVERRAEGECWPWIGARNGNGYGHFKWNGRQGNASRFALEQRLGEPLGQQIALHTCDNPLCCNPAHLRAGTQTDNMRDMVAKGRSRQQQKTHCSRGHPFDEANTYRHRGRRFCRRCNAAAVARSKEHRANQSSPEPNP